MPKRKFFLIIGLILSAVAVMAADPATKTKVLNGEETRQSIIYYASSNVTYIAESYPGAESTNAVWQCTKVLTTGDTVPYSKTVTVLSYLGAPYDGGTNLPILFGD